MKKILFQSLMAASFLLILILPAHADFVVLDDAVFGSGTITFDTDTGLEWLDVSLTTNRSRNYVNTQFGADGEFAGFRYANTEEAVSFAETVSGYFEDPADVAAYWIGLVGATANQWGIDEMAAMTSIGDAVGAEYYYDGEDNYIIGDLNIHYGKNAAYSSIGSWLVRDTSPVPVPSTMGLLAAGLLGLAGIQRYAAIRGF